MWPDHLQAPNPAQATRNTLHLGQKGEHSPMEHLQGLILRAEGVIGQGCKPS